MNNQRPADYESAALPTELFQQTLNFCNDSIFFSQRQHPFSRISLNFISAGEYYKSYNCKSAFISKAPFLSPFWTSVGSQEETVENPFYHLHGNFSKFREEFFLLLNFFQFSPFFDIYINNLIIFFYKELSTLSTQFSTIYFSFIFNCFLHFFHFITVVEVEFSPFFKIRF